MTSVKETDYQHPNERGNLPKARMEGGDQTDDIDINDPETREKHLIGIKQHEKDFDTKDFDEHDFDKQDFDKNDPDEKGINETSSEEK